MTTPNTLDFKKMHQSINAEILKVTKSQNNIIEEKIKQALIDYDCKPSQIMLEVHPSFTYKIKIEAASFSFDYEFNASGEALGGKE